MGEPSGVQQSTTTCQQNNPVTWGYSVLGVIGATLLGMGNLTPFDSERAKRASALGVQAKRAKRLATSAAVSEVVGNLATVRDTLARDELGGSCAAAAQWVVARVVAGQIPVRHAGDAAELLRVLVDVARLEEGSATSVALVGHLGGSDLSAAVAAMRDRARAALASDASVIEVGEVGEVLPSAAAVAVADQPPG